MTPRVLILAGLGINADLELAEAFRRVGGRPERIHCLDLFRDPSALERYHLLALPGGFSFGDHLGSGLVLAHMIRAKLRRNFDDFVARGKPVIGICNGFQVLVKSGIIPNVDGSWTPRVSLIHNTSGRFVDRWVHLAAHGENTSPWLVGLGNFDVPIRHGEGRFVFGDAQARAALAGQVAFLYEGVNPNGSEDGIAGMTDRTGRVLGMMPHPEAYLDGLSHPLRPPRGDRRGSKNGSEGADAADTESPALALLTNGINMAMEAAS